MWVEATTAERTPSSPSVRGGVYVVHALEWALRSRYFFRSCLM